MFTQAKQRTWQFFESRSDVLHGHQAGNPRGQQIMPAPKATRFISGDQWQPYEVQKAAFEKEVKEKKNHFQKPAP